MGAMESYSVRLAKDDLAFSASHFITFAGGRCERLHGHDYRVSAEVRGPLDQNHYVVDFVALRDTLREILAELDHRVLLPTGHPQIQLTVDDREVTATFADRRWVFPRDDCVLLPLPNTTAELLARHIGTLLRETLTRHLGVHFSSISVEVDECLGQSATWTFSEW